MSSEHLMLDAGYWILDIKNGFKLGYFIHPVSSIKNPVSKDQFLIGHWSAIPLNCLLYLSRTLLKKAMISGLA